MSNRLSCFKAYDIRGKVPDELNQDIAYRIGRAYARCIRPRRVIVGYDMRLSSYTLARSLSRALMAEGIDVYDIGLCGTEEVYFATFAYRDEDHPMDGGIMVTASHNPKDYNGMKLVREESKPISGDSGLKDIEQLAAENAFPSLEDVPEGRLHRIDIAQAYLQHLLGYIDSERLRPLKIVVNAGNGAAGHVIDLIEQHLNTRMPQPIRFIKLLHQPDGNFPHGVPNPLLPENRGMTIEAIQAHQADMGVAWDGDFDRCFLFDEHGNFIEGYYIVGLLADAFLRAHPGAKIVHDPRLTWNTIDIVQSHGGTPIQSKTGHAFIKERMRLEDAIYGGEMSAHHYFKSFAYCDSGMIPWLLIAELISSTGKSLSQLVAERMARYPASGEINSKIENPQETINHIRQVYEANALSSDFTDGLSLEFNNWRFNLRCSNTEPVVRLNVEARADSDLMRGKTEELLTLLKQAASAN